MDFPWLSHLPLGHRPSTLYRNGERATAMASGGSLCLRAISGGRGFAGVDAHGWFTYGRSEQVWDKSAWRSVVACGLGAGAVPASSL